MAREEGVRFGADRQAWDRWERGIELEGGRWEAGTVGRTNGRNLKFKQAVKASKGGNGGWWGENLFASLKEFGNEVAGAYPSVGSRGRNPRLNEWRTHGPKTARALEAITVPTIDGEPMGRSDGSDTFG